MTQTGTTTPPAPDAETVASVPNPVGVPGEPQVSAEHAAAMTRFSIRYDGRRYEYDGYHYDRLPDAVAYAERVSTHPSHERKAGQRTTVRQVETQSDADRRLMASLAIEFEAGTYRFMEYRYDRLADAVNYATLMARRHEHDGGR